MKLLEGNIEEYKKRHNPIWSELKEILIDHGVTNYSIFFDNDTNDLFGYAEIEDQNMWKEVANTDICKKWWDFNASLMEVNSDSSPVSKNLLEVFHIEKE